MLSLFHVTVYLREKNNNTAKNSKTKNTKKYACLFSTNVDIIVINTWFGVSIWTRFSAPVLAIGEY